MHLKYEIRIEFVGHFIEENITAPSRSVGFGKDAPENLLWAALYRFCIGRFSTTFQYLARWDWILILILTFIIRRVAPVLKKTRKKTKKNQSKGAKRKDQEDNYKLVKWSVYSVGAGFDTF